MIYPSIQTVTQTHTHKMLMNQKIIRRPSPNDKRLPQILYSRQGIESLACSADVHEGWCIDLLEDEVDEVVVQP